MNKRSTFFGVLAQKIRGTQLLLLVPFVVTSLFANDVAKVDTRAQVETATHAGKEVSKKSKAKWTIMLYIQARNNLSNFAHMNLQDIASIGSDPHVNIVAQWYQSNQAGVWRYKIEKNNINLESVTEKSTNCFSGKHLVDFVRWGYETYPAENYCLVLWDHGIGILDPVWGKPMQIALYDGASPRIEIPGITEFMGCAEDRGILFDEQNHVYMNNQELVETLTHISQDVLGRPLDLLGMDACFMAMFEVGYQVRKCAKILVASQEVELARGWNYSVFLASLGASTFDARIFARSIVDAFEMLYQGKTHLYTQSALDLDHSEALKQNIDAVVSALFDCASTQRDSTWKAIRSARAAAQQFRSPVYVDLHSLYVELLRYLDPADTTFQKYLKPKGSAARDEVSVEEPVDRAAGAANPVRVAKKLIEEGLGIMDRMVIASITSPQLGRARGISIYFPQQKIDDSYARTHFAKDSLWPRFLHQFVNMQ